MTLTAWLPLGLYVAAAVAYFVHFSKRDVRAGRAASVLLVAGVLAHTFMIGMETMEAGYAPLVGTTAAVSAFVWLFAWAPAWWAILPMGMPEGRAHDHCPRQPGHRPVPAEKHEMDRHRDLDDRLGVQDEPPDVARSRDGVPGSGRCDWDRTS